MVSRRVCCSGGPGLLVATNEFEAENSVYEWNKYRHQHLQTLPCANVLSNLHPNQNSFAVWFLELFKIDEGNGYDGGCHIWFIFQNCAFDAADILFYLIHRYMIQFIEWYWKFRNSLRRWAHCNISIHYSNCSTFFHSLVILVETFRTFLYFVFFFFARKINSLRKQSNSLESIRRNNRSRNWSSNVRTYEYVIAVPRTSYLW